MFNAIRDLQSLGHDVHVVSFADEFERKAGTELEAYCASVTVVPRPRFWLARALFGDPPATLAHYFSREMGRVLQQAAHAKRIEIIELETLHMAPYGRLLGSFPRVFRPQNVEHLIWERYAAASRSAALRALWRFQAARIRRYEARAVAGFADSTLAVSEADRAALSAIAPNARVDFLPMGVDTEHFAPSVATPATPWSMVLTGSFDWAPKRANVAVLVNEVLPLIRTRVPAAQLSIVGRGLSGRLLRDIRKRDGVEYVGPVPDVRPYIARSAVVLNYVESGSGIAIKVLEAMAMGKAVVTNGLGVEGIAAINGRHLLVASTKAQFADSVAAVMNEQALALRLGEAARSLVVSKYSSAALTRELTTYFRAMLVASPDRPQMR
jgi:glycosyltransferase involved in cell wall biosynthesis